MTDDEAYEQIRLRGLWRSLMREDCYYLQYAHVCRDLQEQRAFQRFHRDWDAFNRAFGGGRVR